jgi:hypothetical protein
MGATLAVISAQLLYPHPADKDPAAYSFPLLINKGARIARSYGLTYCLPPIIRSPTTVGDRRKSLKSEIGTVPHQRLTSSIRDVSSHSRLSTLKATGKWCRMRSRRRSNASASENIPKADHQMERLGMKIDDSTPSISFAIPAFQIW